MPLRDSASRRFLAPSRVRRSSLHAQGPVQRERVTAGALLALGRQHVNLAQIGERRGEGREPGRVDAVVVGDEEKGHQIRGGKSWSGREDLNLRPQDPQSCALPGCATPRPNQIKCLALGILSPRGGMCRPYLQNRRTTRLTAQWMGMNERRVRGRRREEEVTVDLNESLTSGLQNDARTGAAPR